MTRAIDTKLAERAIEIADDTMLETIRAHCVRAEDFDGFAGCFQPCGGEGIPVPRLNQAERTVIEAYTWLYSRGLARIVPDRQGNQIIVLTKGE